MSEHDQILEHLRRIETKLDKIIARLDAPNVPDDLLTTEQAAEFLGMSKGAVLQAVQRGSLPVHRLGRRLRFKRRELSKSLRQ